MLKSQHFTVWIYSLPSAPITLVLDGNFQLLLPKRLPPSPYTWVFRRRYLFTLTVDVLHGCIFKTICDIWFVANTDITRHWKTNRFLIKLFIRHMETSVLRRHVFGSHAFWCLLVRNNGEGRSAVAENKLLVFVSWRFHTYPHDSSLELPAIVNVRRQKVAKCFPKTKNRPISTCCRTIWTLVAE